MSEDWNRSFRSERMQLKLEAQQVIKAICDGETNTFHDIVKITQNQLVDKHIEIATSPQQLGWAIAMMVKQN
jgi:hypothetical protein|tara:strand:+ start:218 stop:433 length:216 start_codon:yes stop_codon:yes gene_type:complete